LNPRGPARALLTALPVPIRIEREVDRCIERYMDIDFEPFTYTCIYMYIYIYIFVYIGLAQSPASALLMALPVPIYRYIQKERVR